MMFRVGRLPAVALMVVAAGAVAGCATRVTGGGADEPMTMVTVDPSTVAVDVGDVDAVVVMMPGVGATFEPPSSPGAELISSRHVLRLPTTAGPIDMFDYRVRDAAMGPGVQLCRGTVFRGGSSAGCGPAGEFQPDPASLTVGSIWTDGTNLVVEIDGPDDVTHLVAEYDGQRIALVPVESLGVASFGQDACASGLTVEAWRSDTLLATEEVGDLCPG